MFLSIAGTTVRVAPAGQAQNVQAAPILVGALSRAFDGTLRSTIRAEKRTFTFMTANLTYAQADALHTATKNGTIVVITGDAVNNVALNGVVTISQRYYVIIAGGYRVQLQLDIQEA